MYEYGGGPDDSLRHNHVQFTEEDIVSMSTLLVNGKYEDCSVVGLNPFCQLNPVPEANSDFWKVKYDHEAAKKAKAAAINAKKTTQRSKKKKKSIVEDLMKLDDTSDSEGPVRPWKQSNMRAAVKLGLKMSRLSFFKKLLRSVRMRRCLALLVTHRRRNFRP